MSTIGSSLSKGADGTALINQSVLAQLAGIAKDLSRSAFDAAVTAERANITNNGTGVWNNGEKISILTEIGTRIWFVGSSGANSHARNVSYLGKTYALAADSNVFGATTGVPASGTGANGDILVDAAAGLLYGPKSAGAWPAGVALVSATAAVITPVIIDGSTIVASTGSPYQMQTGDRFVVVNKTTGAPTKILLPTNPTIGAEYKIKDGKGDANTNNITIAAANGVTIEGGTTAVLNTTSDGFASSSVTLSPQSATVWWIV